MGKVADYTIWARCPVRTTARPPQLTTEAKWSGHPRSRAVPRMLFYMKTGRW